MNLKITTRALLRAEERLRIFKAVSSAGTVSAERSAAASAEALALRQPLAAAVDAALARVNGRASAHVLTGYAEVRALADWAEETLAARGVKEANRVGTLLIHRGAGPGKSYAANSRRVLVTALQLKRVADGWRLIDLDRESIFPTWREESTLKVSAAAAEDIRAAAFDGVKVKED